MRYETGRERVGGDLRNSAPTKRYAARTASAPVHLCIFPLACYFWRRKWAGFAPAKADSARLGAGARERKLEQVRWIFCGH